MACSAANRNMVYYTFNDLQLCHTIHEIYTFVAANRITIGELFHVKPSEFSSALTQYFHSTNVEVAVPLLSGAGET